MKKTALILLVLCLFLPGTAADNLSPRGSIPFALRHGHLIVTKCTVGSLSDLTAVIDTGVSETVLDLDVVKRLQLETHDASATFLIREVKVREIAIPDLQLGPLRTERLDGIAVDLSPLTVQFGFRPQVLIGMDLLRQANLTIDYRARQLLIGAVLPLRHSTRMLSSPGSRFAVIEARITGKRMRLQVDSGFNGLLLYSGATSANMKLVSRESRIANPAQTLLARSCASSDFEIGDWRPASVQLAVVDGAPPESAGFDGLIGTTFLSNRRIAFDFDNGLIHWE